MNRLERKFKLLDRLVFAILVWCFAGIVFQVLGSPSMNPLSLFGLFCFCMGAITAFVITPLLIRRFDQKEEEMVA